MTDRAVSVSPTDEVNAEWLKMIQNIIDRMARESANLKTWSIALIAAVVLLIRATGESRWVWLGAALVALLGVLDCYYLGAERRFRELYRHAAGLTQASRHQLWCLNPWHEVGAEHCAEAASGDEARPEVALSRRRLAGTTSFWATVWEGCRWVSVGFAGFLFATLAIVGAIPSHTQEHNGHQYLPQPSQSPRG